MIVSSEDKEAFLGGLKTKVPKSAILSVVYKNNTDTQAPRIKHLPSTLDTLYQSKYASLNQDELQAKCEEVFSQLKVTQAEADYLEKSTKLQHQSILWYKHRKGRITASKIFSVCHTSLTKPSKVLINSILQENPRVHAASLEWGIKNESIAREKYRNEVCTQHESFKLELAGLFVNPSYPYLGASPDGLVSCRCCGDGLIEIKCPFSIRNSDPKTVCTSNFYLKHTEEGLQLSRKHNYYLQIQGQLAICQRSYCDFICWTPKGMYLERIKKDDMIWLEAQKKLEAFFKTIILPRILVPESRPTGNNLCPSTSPSTDSKDDSLTDDYPSSLQDIDDSSTSLSTDKENDSSVDNCHGQVFCFCRKGEEGYMIACDNIHCPYEWFHFSCVSLSSAPEGDWYCPECRNN